VTAIQVRLVHEPNLTNCWVSAEAVIPIANLPDPSWLLRKLANHPVVPIDL
jgi:chorismate-pyruvate lyase